MSFQQIMNDFELIVMLTQKRIRDVAVERAWTLAEMAVQGICPDESFTEKECDIWNRYRYRVEVEKSMNSKEGSP